MSSRPIFNKIYDSEYYSGHQTFLYIGDVLVDEVTSLAYEVVQSKNPIYGYASQLFDDCAPGRVLVNGMFTINFKEQGYLWMVLRRYKEIMDSAVGFNSKREKELLAVRQGHRRDMPSLTNKKDIRVGSNGTSISRSSIERIVQGYTTRGEQNKFYHDLTGYSTFRVKGSKDKVFEDVAEAFEDQIWEPEVKNEDLINQVRRVDDNIFDDFDIYVLFGDYSNPRANHTCIKIVGVRITSHGKQIAVGGNPVQESYSFLARCVV